MSVSNLSSLLDLVRRGAIDRRGFLQGAAATGIGATAAAALFRDVAAQSAPPQASPVASPVELGSMTKSITRDEYRAQLREHFAFEGAASTGGQVIYVSTVDMKTVNPVIRNDVAAEFVTANVYSNLVTASPIDGSMAPDLADYWEMAADGRTYRFALNAQATWHDGQPVTADDVVFTVDAVMAESGLSPFRSDFVQIIESCRAVDEHTVEIVTRQPVATFLQKTVAQTGIVPKHIWESIPVGEWGSASGSTGSDPSQVIGSGPFTFVEWIQGDHATIAKNEDYWLPDLIPAIDQFTLRVVADATSAIQSIATGEADIADLPAPQVDAFKTGNPDMVVDVYDTFRFSFFVPNQDPENGQFFSVKEVRQALMYALDRESIVENLLDGYGAVANGTQPVISRAYAPDRVTTIYGYDVEKAQSLLEAAGWVDSDGDGIREKDGVKMSMEFPYNSSDPTYDTLVPYLQQAWSAVGIDIQPTALPLATLIDRGYANDFQLMLIGITWNEEDQAGIFRTGGGFNLMRYSSAEFDALNDEQLIELDDAKRMDLIIEQSNLANDEMAAGILFFNKAATASTPGLHNLRPNAYGSIWSISYAWAENV